MGSGLRLCIAGILTGLTPATTPHNAPALSIYQQRAAQRAAQGAPRAPRRPARCRAALPSTLAAGSASLGLALCARFSCHQLRYHLLRL